MQAQWPTERQKSGNAFFNTIYIQDEEGNGINVFPIDDSNIRRGDQVQITGSVSEYIGDKQLSAISVTVLEGTKDVVITDTTTKEANDYETNFGKLVRVRGEVDRRDSCRRHCGVHHGTG